uniref:Ribosyldihydronicotinamide dehydrogenase [quinone] n=1 Tax=Geotrypetes seraphini TaxID=260995 RepID=A0A6P8PXP4_GEOSA|nr:ribosyldihydronicotinamide dehydrogenase [quinone] [Geotrypetes seraphini]
MNGSLKNTAEEVLSKQGCSVTVSDLYAMHFEATATRSDITGHLHNPEHFNYGNETRVAQRRGNLCKDILEEQKKVQEADLVIFQYLAGHMFPPVRRFETTGLDQSVQQRQDKLVLLSFTTGGTEEMFSKEGESGDVKYLLWPIQHGMMHFCGFTILTSQITFAPEYVTENVRNEMLTSWARRLETIWNEKTIICTPPWYFQ